MTESAAQKAPRLVGLRGAKLAPLWEETGVRWVLQARPTRRCDGGHIPKQKRGTRKPPSGSRRRRRGKATAR